jgi:hypothetical protein
MVNIEKLQEELSEFWEWLSKDSCAPFNNAPGWAIFATADFWEEKLPGCPIEFTACYSSEDGAYESDQHDLVKTVDASRLYECLIATELVLCELLRSNLHGSCVFKVAPESHPELACYIGYFDSNEDGFTTCDVEYALDACQKDIKELNSSYDSDYYPHSGRNFWGIKKAAKATGYRYRKGYECIVVYSKKRDHVFATDLKKGTQLRFTDPADVVYFTTTREMSCYKIACCISCAIDYAHLRDAKRNGAR